MTLAVIEAFNKENRPHIPVADYHRRPGESPGKSGLRPKADRKAAGENVKHVGGMQPRACGFYEALAKAGEDRTALLPLGATFSTVEIMMMKAFVLWTYVANYADEAVSLSWENDKSLSSAIKNHCRFYSEDFKKKATFHVFWATPAAEARYVVIKACEVWIEQSRKVSNGPV